MWILKTDERGVLFLDSPPPIAGFTGKPTMQQKPDELLPPEQDERDDAHSTANLLKTWATPPKRLETVASKPACLVQIYPTGAGMGSRHTLEEKTMSVGRDKDCDISIDDPSISRRHAEIRPGMSGHYVIDQKSTNGTFINDKPASLHQLRDGDYVRFSNWIFRYLTGNNVEAEYHEEIYRLTIIDGLTGTHNKRALLDFLERDLARAHRHQRPISLMMFDIDHFKAINDQWGHLAGDAALRELSQRIRAATRGEDFFARYGGEEFALVLPETRLDQARDLAERLRRLIEEQPFTFNELSFPVTISIGVVGTQGETRMEPFELVRLADEKLYQAKNAGRNCVVA